jgi:hypothetical protein
LGRDEALHPIPSPPAATIYDVVARAIYQIDDLRKTVHIFAMGPTSTGPIRVPASKKPIAWQVDTRPPETSVKEELPPEQIAGLMATGTRTTYTIPAGREGNDQDLTVIDELWRSHLYGISLMHVHNDPRHGDSVYRVTRLISGEPDESLFQVPMGYRVDDKRVAATAPDATLP